MTHDDVSGDDGDPLMNLSNGDLSMRLYIVAGVVFPYHLHCRQWWPIHNIYLRTRKDKDISEVSDTWTDRKDIPSSSNTIPGLFDDTGCEIMFRSSSNRNCVFHRDVRGVVIDVGFEYKLKFVGLIMPGIVDIELG